MKVTLAIDYTKDVDGFHPVNFGRMAQSLPLLFAGNSIWHHSFDGEIWYSHTAGKHVVVVGRSNIWEHPLASCFQKISNR